MLRVAARLSSCGWCWLTAWPILGWALQSGNCGSVGCRASHSPRPPQCRSGKWHYRACWSLGWEGWPAEAPYRCAQSSWTPLYWENWREMGNLIFYLFRQMCLSVETPSTHERVKMCQKNSILTSCWKVGVSECCLYPWRQCLVQVSWSPKSWMLKKHEHVLKLILRSEKKLKTWGNK